MKLRNLLKENAEDKAKKLTSEQRARILDGVSKFNEYGKSVYRETDIRELTKTLKELSEQASNLAITEAGDWFDEISVKRDMKEVNNSVKLFEKAAKELNTLQQRLESVFEDVGHKLGKYYNISEALDAVGKEDGDVDNDGDEDESDEYLMKKRAAITKAVKSESTIKEAPKMKTSREEKYLGDLAKAVERASKGGSAGRYSKEFASAKKRALKAIKDMHTYARIGV